MSSPPPAKRFRQATILEGFKRQESVGKPAESVEFSAAKHKKEVETTEQGVSPLDETYDDVEMENLTEEERKKREEARQKCLKAAEKGLRDSQGDNDNKAGSSKVSNHSNDNVTETENESKTKSDGAAEAVAMSPTQEYDDLDNSEPLFDSEPNSQEFDDELPMENIEFVDTSGTGVSMGVEKSKLNRSPGCRPPLPQLKANSIHQVLVTTPLTKGEIPKPYPPTLRDRWDNDHVKMPYSKDNLYPIEGKAGQKELANRWNLIEVALKGDITSSFDLEEAIIKYNSRYSQKWDFSGLHAYFTEVAETAETNAFFKNILPKVVNLALRLPYICTQPLRLLKQNENQSVTISQEQAACLLANAFFCTFPRRNARGKQAEYSLYPDINFNQLFAGGRKGGIAPRKAEKLKCILNYFRRVTSEMPTGTITFKRQVIKTFPAWSKSKTILAPLYVTSAGTIEDDGSGMLQVDFANKYLGGGVLGYGLVQEEIRFMICPEMILSRLITQVLDSNESLFMIGCEQFSKYTGYGDTFEWAGNFVDQTPRDEWGRRCIEVVAIDALIIRNHMEQFKPHQVRRELNKAYAGYFAPGSSKPNLPAVATGNWGCGAFGGDHQLKALLQLMAAAEAGRSTAYFTFGNTRLAKDLHNMHTFFTANQVSLGELWNVINKYQIANNSYRGTRPKENLYEFIFNFYTSGMGDDTDEDVPQQGSSHQSASDARPPSPDWQANTP